MSDQRHPEGYVGYIFRVDDPNGPRVGNCFFRGRLKEGDHVLCVAHSGDCFQDYIFLDLWDNCIFGLKNYRFGSYGMDGATRLGELTQLQMVALEYGLFLNYSGGVLSVSRTVLEPEPK